MRIGKLAILTTLVFALPSLGRAATPSFLPVQGYLTDASGVPVTGLHTITASLHDDLDGGNLLFTETQELEVEGGFFTLYVGANAGTPLDPSLFRGPVLYLGLAIDGESEMLPRLPLGMAPYAAVAASAADADTLQGSPASDFAQASHAHAFTSLTGIPAGLADGDDDSFAAITCASGMLLESTGAGWACVAGQGGGVSQAYVDGAVATLEATLTPVATGGAFSDLTGVPTGLADGDDDTLAGLTCTSGMLLESTGTGWACVAGQGGGVTQSYVDDAVAALATGLAPIATTGSWNDLANVPAGFVDGTDADVLGGLGCTEGQVAKKVAGVWACATDLDTHLTEAEVDGMVANNGYAAASSLHAVATTGAFSDLTGIPTGLADGDNDTLAGVTCAAGRLLRWTGAAWDCVAPVTESQVDIWVANNGYALASGLAPIATTGNWNDLVNVPAGFADGTDADALGGLGCLNGQIAKKVSGVWTCAADLDTHLTEAEVDAMVANNGYAAASSLHAVATSGAFSDLVGVPADLADGDDDTLAGVSCAAGLLLRKSANGWDCVPPVDEAQVDAWVGNNGYALASGLAAIAGTGRWSDLVSVPAGFADGTDNDALGALNCGPGQIAKKLAAGGWGCMDDRVLTEAEVDAMAGNNGYVAMSTGCPAGNAPVLDSAGNWVCGNFIANQRTDLQGGGFRIDGLGTLHGGLSVGTDNHEATLTVKGGAVIRSGMYEYRFVGPRTCDTYDPEPCEVPPSCPCDSSQNGANCPSVFSSPTNLPVQCADVTYVEPYEGAYTNYNLYEISPEPTLYVNDNKVGVGTGAPTERLDVDGNAVVRGNLTVSGNLTVTGGSNVIPQGTWCGLCMDLSYSVFTCGNANICLQTSSCPAGWTMRSVNLFGNLNNERICIKN